MSEPGTVGSGTVGSGIRLATVLGFLDIAVDALAGAREEIDALNVYPVPDGDTGTNMYLTMAAARDAVRERTGGDPAADRDATFEAFTRGALLGARGNSGVILSEMLRAIIRRIAEATPEERNGAVMVDALRRATEASYAAVGTPVEGTMLSVCRAASESAQALLAEHPMVRSRDVLTTSAAAAREALARTPEQLEILRAAGVVDAGGRGVVVILDAAETALTGRRPPRVEAGRRIPRPVLAEPGGDLVDGGPAYEVMYLLDAPDQAIAGLRTALAALGDSLVVVGGEGLWNVHVHVDDVGAAIEAGIEAGRPHRVRVTHFAEQAAARDRQPRTGRAIVAVAAGPGLAELFEQSGAVVVVGSPGNRPSTGMLLEAIAGSGAQEVVVLPNDHDSVRAAQVAASTAETDHGVRVAVIPTTAQVEGLAALAVHEPGRTFDQDVLEMTATARHARQGAVTVAAKQAITMAGPCEPGDVLGAIGGDFVVVGADLTDVAVDVLGRLLGGGGELVTLVSGHDDAGGALARACADWLEEQHPAVDVVVYDGGQERYPLLVAVE
ncbi:DAK2 domain-containing protein [uncultured Nocardioides sp.]|uniref:DAK2 domain-containing protein n=1 Tax=uncultured Nocardioides sp. TaxID=198441 RepID=UPI00263048BE|nr:DAK2 domain-containing protein [uncultured Nocardioides sp.]